MMTTMAALLGAVPLAFGTGDGSELRRPLGITIIGGLLLSQLLTLYTTPVIYLFFDNIARRFATFRKRHGSGSEDQKDPGLTAGGAVMNMSRSLSGALWPRLCSP